MFTLRLVHSSIHSLTPATMYRATAQCLAWKTFDWIASSHSERNRGTDRMAPLCIPHLHARQSAVSLDEPRDATTVRDEWGWQCLVSELSRFVGHTERRCLVDGPPQDSNSQCDKKITATPGHCTALLLTKCDHSKKRPNETKMDYPTVFIQHWRLLKYFEFDLCCCCLCCYFFPIPLSRDCFPQQRRGRPLLLSMFNAQESRGCIIWYRILRGTEEDTLSRFIATFA